MVSHLRCAASVCTGLLSGCTSATAEEPPSATVLGDLTSYCTGGYEGLLDHARPGDEPAHRKRRQRGYQDPQPVEVTSTA
jgi:hypothetical protein